MKLHQEGLLQRMLEIPIGVDPLEYLSHSHSYVPILSPPTQHPPRPLKRQREDQNLSAIIVNDDEIDLGDLDSDAEDEFEEGDMEDDEEGDITVVVPNGTTQQSDRFASVSVDSAEEEELVNGNPRTPVEEEDDSRYALGNGEAKRTQSGQASQTAIEVDDSDDDSVVAIDPPPNARSKSSRVQQRAKKDFWAGKGKVEPDVEDDEE